MIAKTKREILRSKDDIYTIIRKILNFVVLLHYLKAAEKCLKVKVYIHLLISQKQCRSKISTVAIKHR